MSANQLLEKALSTASEDEAIACLKMARKKGLKLTVVNMNPLYEKELATAYRTIHFFKKGNDKISDELVSYQAGLIVTVICFSIALLFALVL